MTTKLPPPYLANPDAPTHSFQVSSETSYPSNISPAPTGTWTELDQDALIGAAFQKIRDQLVEKRVLLKPFLQDFDRTRTGHITREQFQRTLGMLCIALPRRGLDALMDLYATPRFPGSFNYRGFLDTLNQDEAQFAQGAGNTTTEPALRKTTDFKATARSPPEPTDALRKFLTVAQQRRIIMDNIFADFDKLRTGRVSQAEFIRSLTIAGLAMTEPENWALMQPFIIPSENGRVDYPAFLRSAHQAISDLNGPAEFTPWKPEHDNERKLEDDEATAVRGLIHQMAHVTLTRGILLKPLFQDFDRNKNGCVTERQFRSCAAHIPVKLTEREWEYVCNHYRKGELGISYAEFCQDLKDAEQFHATKKSLPLEQTATTVLGTKIAPPAGDKSVSVDAVLARLRADVSRTRTDISDVFYDFDTLRKGHVSATQFRRCLAIKNIHVSDEEMLAILAEFTVQPGRIDYLGFVNALNPITNRRFGHTTPLPQSGQDSELRV